MNNNEYYISDLAIKWIEQLHEKEFNSTSEEMTFQKYAYCDGYEKGFKDAIEKAKQIIISFMPLPSNKNHNITQCIDLLEERQKYAHQVAEKFEEMMTNKEKGIVLLRKNLSTIMPLLVNKQE